MTSRTLLVPGLAAVLAGCAVPYGQIRNGRFSSEQHGSLKVRNQTIAFDLRDLPPGVRVKKRVFYRLQPDQTIDLNLRLAEDFRSGVGACQWRLQDGEIIATLRHDPASMVIFSRPGKRRAPAAIPPSRPAKVAPTFPPPPSDVRPLPIIIQ